MDWMKWVMLAIQYAPTIKRLIDQGAPIATVVQKELPQMMPAITDLAKQLFPKVSTEIGQITAASQAIFNPNGTVWIQRALNKVQNAGLDEDGIMGRMTRDAVMTFQKNNQPDAGPVDGWVGSKTQAVLARRLAEAGGLEQ